MKTYDCFLFYNEIDILELRFNILNDYVDEFVLVESTKTFSGKEKPLLFLEKADIFSEFKHKIRHVIIDDTPENFKELSLRKDIFAKNTMKCADFSSMDWQWCRETYQRECLLKGLSDCTDSDFVLISDVDEIPSPESLTLSNKDKVSSFKQEMYYYYFNMLKQKNWSGTKSAPFRILKDITINHLRQDKHTDIFIDKGGWHFSFFGDSDFIKKKIQAYSHQEFNNTHYLNSIEANMEKGNDPFFRGALTRTEIDDSYPSFLINNIDKYDKYIKK